MTPSPLLFFLLTLLQLKKPPCYFSNLSGDSSFHSTCPHHLECFPYIANGSFISFNSLLKSHPLKKACPRHLHSLNEWVKVAQSCPTLCDPKNYTVHGILQVRILERVAFPFSKTISPFYSLITSTKSHLLRKVTLPQVLGIRMWTSLTWKWRC